MRLSRDFCLPASLYGENRADLNGDADFLRMVPKDLEVEGVSIAEVGRLWANWTYKSWISASSD